MAQRTDRACVEHRLGALPAHDLLEIEIDHRRQARGLRLEQHGLCVVELLAIGFSANTGLPSASARIAICACKDGTVAIATACTDGILDQSAPVAVSFGTPSTCASSRVRAALLPASAIDLAARIGAERRQLHNASIVTTDNAETDHGAKAHKMTDLRRAAWI